MGQCRRSAARTRSDAAGAGLCGCCRLLLPWLPVTCSRQALMVESLTLQCQERAGGSLRVVSAGQPFAATRFELVLADAVAALYCCTSQSQGDGGQGIAGRRYLGSLHRRSRPLTCWMLAWRGWDGGWYKRLGVCAAPLESDSVDVKAARVEQWDHYAAALRRERCGGPAARDSVVPPCARSCDLRKRSLHNAHSRPHGE